MAIAYSLTPELRRRLKQPLGVLIQGSFIDAVNRFKELAEKEKPSCIISVGDTVSRNLVKNGVIPKLAIVDNLAMRKATQPFLFKAGKVVDVRNPAATITDEAVVAIQDALRGSSLTKIVVEGEEDLLALVAISFAPEDAFVVYGQPYEGIVVVKVTSAKKAEVAAILKAMENVRKAK